MTSSAQYSALTRLLTHNNRVRQLEDLLLQLPVPSLAAPVNSNYSYNHGFLPDLSWESDFVDEPNPIADLQDDIDREARASLVACWFAMPRDFDDLEEA